MRLRNVHRLSRVSLNGLSISDGAYEFMFALSLKQVAVQHQTHLQRPRTRFNSMQVRVYDLAFRVHRFDVVSSAVVCFHVASPNQIPRFPLAKLDNQRFQKPPLGEECKD